MSNPSGDGTITSLPSAATLTGKEVIPADQAQGVPPQLVTVKIPISSFVIQGVTGVTYGTTTQRPSSPLPGQAYFDTTLGFQINWNPVTSHWVATSGAPV